MLEIKKRCEWVNLKNSLMVNYHDTEWGIPVYDDQKLFEILILEGAQAGLSWQTVLQKRVAYKKYFKNLDPVLCARISNAYLEKQCKNQNIIRHRLKILSIKKNAQVFLKVQREFHTFADYLWTYVNRKPIVNAWKSVKNIPTKTKISEKLSKDLKKRGMSFVGPTIMYAYMQAVGLVNDHTKNCFKTKNKKQI